MIDELKETFDSDLRKVTERTKSEDFTYKYPEFVKKVEEKAKSFKAAAHRYRHICGVPSFALGLVMASRIQSHYTHSPWFKLGILGDMLDVYGTVR